MAAGSVMLLSSPDQELFALGCLVLRAVFKREETVGNFQKVRALAQSEQLFLVLLICFLSIILFASLIARTHANNR